MFIDKRLKEWIEASIDSVTRHGITETDSFEAEVVYTMEESAERELAKFERDAVGYYLSEVDRKQGLTSEPITHGV